jgi:hypothetical protein
MLLLLFLFQKTRQCIRTIEAVHNAAINSLVVAPVADSKHVAIWFVFLRLL